MFPAVQVVVDVSIAAFAPEKIQILKHRAEDIGREPDSINITVFGASPGPDNLARMEESGVDRVLFGLPSETADTVTPILDDCAKLL